MKGIFQPLPEHVILHMGVFLHVEKNTNASCLVPKSPILKVRKAPKISNLYNQVPHLTQDTTRESNKIQLNMKNKSQEVSPFPAGDHKAAMNRRESMTNTRHK